MLGHLRASWRGERAILDRLLRRYYLACCRRIWKLLPMDESRRGVEVAEHHLTGNATDEELRKAVWHAEGVAVLFLDGFEDLEPEKVARCIEEVEAISAVELGALLGPAYPTAWRIDARSACPCRLSRGPRRVLPRHRTNRQY